MASAFAGIGFNAHANTDADRRSHCDSSEPDHDLGHTNGAACFNSAADTYCIFECACGFATAH
jgi:hypothetical protein